MKTVLVGTDFSESARRALELACQLASRDGGKVHLLHVLEPVDELGSTDPETQEFYEKLTKQSKEKLAQAVSGATSEIETQVRIGVRCSTLLEAAQELEADLIVLGSQPINPDSRRFGTSHRVAVTARRPVLLVPHG